MPHHTSTQTQWKIKFSVVWSAGVRNKSRGSVIDVQVCSTKLTMLLLESDLCYKAHPMGTYMDDCLFEHKPSGVAAADGNN